MCSICGMIALPGCKVDRLEAQKILGGLLEAGMSRGIDATGFAWKSPPNNGKEVIHVHKAPLAANEFVRKDLPNVWPQHVPEVVIGHTRASTKGSERLVGNNHPVYDARAGVAVVHNGVIGNDDELFMEHRMEREAQVDSEVIPKLIGYHYWDGETGIRGDMDAAVKAAAEELSGSFAFLTISAYHPGVLWLVKNHNPAVLCYLPDLKMMLIASVDSYFEQALGRKRTLLDFFTCWECSERMLLTEVQADTILRIDYHADDPDRMIDQTPFTTSVSPWWHSRSSWLINDDFYGFGYGNNDRQTESRSVRSAITDEGDIGDLVADRSGTGECEWRVQGYCVNPVADEGPFPCYMAGSRYGGRYRRDMCPTEATKGRRC